jgi:hypothetical protein
VDSPVAIGAQALICDRGYKWVHETPELM